MSYQVEKLIYNVDNPQIADRLITLFHDAKEEDPDGPGIDVESLSNFYQFLQENINLRYPNITLTPDYHIYATWKDEQGPKRLFFIHFFPKGKTKFGVINFNIDIFGTVPCDMLMKIVIPCGIEDWVNKKEE